MAETSIEWTDAVWNPVRGCSIVSAGCGRCYAMRMAHRFSGLGRPYEGLTRMTSAGPVWSGEVRTVPELLDVPLRWRGSRRVFVNSMSDLFHEGVPFEFVAAVFGVMAAARRHTFQILTKRPERMLEFFRWVDAQATAHNLRHPVICEDAAAELHVRLPVYGAPYPWPLPNVWLGASVEDQKAADERIPLMLQVPAAVRFLSVEPMLGPVDLRRWMDRFDALLGRDLHWVICGGESGPGARPFDLAWARSLRDQCREAGTAFFLKQLGSEPIQSAAAGHLFGSLSAVLHPKGGDMTEWPSDLRIRQFPEVSHG